MDDDEELGPHPEGEEEGLNQMLLARSAKDLYRIECVFLLTVNTLASVKSNNVIVLTSAQRLVISSGSSNIDDSVLLLGFRYCLWKGRPTI